ncbi:MAG: carboxypeptidase-like regulatory domain-containing protein [Bacteroidales bacterium]|nr:carboxypeptidase-like regulatory domain-containing protein [Bacteroidales bacterium]
MKLWLPAICFIFIFNNGYSQTIKGKVTDERTKQAIPFATIYYSGTTVGTTADENGCFELRITEGLSKPLTISSVGYYSKILADFSLTQPVSVQLKPKIHELKDIVVSGKKSENIRKENFPVFRREFLGSSWNAGNCKIINENDILLSYDPENKTLKAFASNPIQILNNALGYNIVYFLDNFKLCKTDNILQYVGNYIFIPANSTDPKQQQQYEDKRRKAYLGSTMHFFRTLWNNSFDSAGFTVSNPNGVKLSYNDFVVESVDAGSEIHQKYVNHQGSLYVHYKGKVNEMILKKERVQFDENGFFDPLGIVWNGEMGQQRIADLLPFEYELPDEDNSQYDTENQADTNDLPGYYQPADQVFLQLDRNLYHPGDTIMFQAYIRNRRNGVFETRSASLYTVLLNQKHEKLDSARFRIFNATAPGWLKVPDTLNSGNYSVLAYTSTMMNYDPEFVFSAPVSVHKISPFIQKIKFQVEKPDSSTHHLSSVKMNVDLRFLPEGGTCIADIPQRMAFNAVASSGKTLKVQGEVKNQLGESICRFISGTYGSGLIAFTPKQGDRYFAFMDGEEFSGMKWPLPIPESSGAALRVDYDSPEVLEIQVEGSGVKDRNYHLTVTLNEMRVHDSDIRLDSTFKLMLGTADLPAGTACVTLYDNEQKPVAERLVFINAHKKMNIEISSSSIMFQQGDETEITLNTTNHKGEDISALLSIAVVDSITGYYDSEPIQDIESTFLYDKDFYNNLPASIKLQGLSQLGIDDIDLLLMTYGWRKIHIKESHQVVTADQLVDYDFLKITNPGTRKTGRSEITISTVESPEIITIPIDNKRESFLFYDSLNPYIRQILILPDEDPRRNTSLVNTCFPGNATFTEKAKIEHSHFGLPGTDKSYTGKEHPVIFRDSVINIDDVVVKAAKKRVYANEHEEQYKTAQTTTLKREDMITCFNFEDVLVRCNLYKLDTRKKEVELRFYGNFGAQTSFPAMFVLNDARVGYDYSMIADIPAAEITSVTILKGSLGYNRYGARYGIIFVVTKNGSDPTYKKYPNTRTDDLMKPVRLFRTEIEYYIPTREEIQAIPEFQNRPTLYWKNEVFLDGTGPVTIRYPNNIVRGTAMVIVNGVSFSNCIGSKRYRYILK